MGLKVRLKWCIVFVLVLCMRRNFTFHDLSKAIGKGPHSTLSYTEVDGTERVYHSRI